ncbi:unnamed protein product [Ectocarpus sp. 12 AP-2014]
MSDSLDDLLSSCSLASRAIRLLTAETKRRAIFLRACCSQYEVALERLSEARLDSLQQDSRLQHAQREPPPRQQQSLTKPDRRRKAGQSRFDGRQGSKAAGCGVASATTDGQVRCRSASSEASTALDTATTPFAISETSPSPRNGHQVSTNDYADSQESSRITKSLEEILEQARRIRTSNVSKTVSAGLSDATGAKRADIPSSGSSSVPRGYPKAARSVTGKAQSTASSSSGGGVGVAPGARSKRANSVPGRPSYHAGTGTIRKATSPLVATRDNERRGNAISRSGNESGSSHSGAHRSHVPSSQRSATQSECLEHVEEQAQALEASEATVNEVAAGIAANLESGMWEEIVCYEAARARFLGRDEGSSGSSGGDGGSMGHSSRAVFEAAEESLLRDLDAPGLDGSCADGYPQARGSPLPDPVFFRWREMLRVRQAPRYDATPRQDVCHGQDLLGGDNAGCTDLHCPERSEGCAAGAGEAQGQCEVGRLREIQLLQRSLLMLLDEAEGKREVFAQEERRRERYTGVETWRGRDTRQREERSDEEGMSRLLQEFEDWYCRNKAGHVTGLIRETLDAMTHDPCGDTGLSTLSEEAKALVENPSLVLTGENPLCTFPGPFDGCAGRKDWQHANMVQALRNTACFALVEELQCRAPSCWPHDSDSALGHTAELFARQLWTNSVLAAETDISRLVVDENGESSDEDAEQPPLVNADARKSDGEEQQQQLSAGVSESAPLTVRVKVEPKSHTEGREQIPRRRIAMLWAKLRAIAYITSLEAYSQERQKAYNLLTMEFVVASEYDSEADKPATKKEDDQNHPAWLQGDIDMYSSANQKKRKRLKRAPAVQEKIKTLWSLATSDGEGCDVGASLSKETFLSIMVKIHVLIIFPPVDLSWAMTNALKDWEKDNAGLDTMNLDRFIDSIFELVDIWTETTEEQEYLDMLDLLTRGITKEIPRIGSLCWKPVEEIRYDPRITKVAVTMGDVLDGGERSDPGSTTVDVKEDGRNQGSGPSLHKLHSFAQMKQVSKGRAENACPARSRCLVVCRGSEQLAIPPRTQALRPSLALGRWQRAVSMAMIVSKVGNSGGLHQYISGGKNKQGMIKIDKLLVSIAKIYKAKEQVDAKMLVLEMKEGRFAPGKRRKHHRLDRFLLQYYIRQFGTKTLARKKLRQFVSSISKEGLAHPRVTLFAKLSGIPVSTEDAREFRPFALTDYFLPIIRLLVPPGKDLDLWMGTGKEPAFVLKNVFVGAVLRVLKSVPESSKAMAVFTEKLGALCDTTDQRKALEQSQRSSKRAYHSDKREASKRTSLGKSGAPSETSNRPAGAREQGGKRYIELDEALLAVVPLWQAEVRTMPVLTAGP